MYRTVVPFGEEMGTAIRKPEQRIFFYMGRIHLGDSNATACAVASALV